MGKIESLGLIEKGYQTGGRIPTSKGCKYYSQVTHSEKEQFFEERLLEIFLNRRTNIYRTIDKAIEAISETINLAIITTSDPSAETLRSIRLTVISEDSAVIVIVTSFARTESKLFQLSEGDNIKMDDIRVAIRIFNERLIDVSLVDLTNRAYALKDILKTQVVNYESLFERFIQNVFDFSRQKFSKIYNQESLILSDNLPRKEIVRILKLAEGASIWEMIEDRLEEDDTIKFQLLNSQDVMLISKKFNELPYLKEISIIASKRMDQEHSLKAVKLLTNLINNFALKRVEAGDE